MNFEKHHVNNPAKTHYDDELYGAFPLTKTNNTPTTPRRPGALKTHLADRCLDMEIKDHLASDSLASSTNTSLTSTRQSRDNGITICENQNTQGTPTHNLHSSDSANSVSAFPGGLLPLFPIERLKNLLGISRAHAYTPG